MAVRLSAFAPAALYPPGRVLVLISVRRWVDPRAIVRLEGLGPLKKVDLIGTRTRDLSACSIVPPKGLLQLNCVDVMLSLNVKASCTDCSKEQNVSYKTEVHPVICMFHFSYSLPACLVTLKLTCITSVASPLNPKAHLNIWGHWRLCVTFCLTENNAYELPFKWLLSLFDERNCDIDFPSGFTALSILKLRKHDP
jgi:hypothetical protein